MSLCRRMLTRMAALTSGTIVGCQQDVRRSDRNQTHFSHSTAFRLGHAQEVIKDA